MFAEARAQSRCQTMCIFEVNWKKLLEVDGGDVPQATPLEDCYLDPWSIWYLMSPLCRLILLVSPLYVIILMISRI